ncbi:MAG: hypothetical protein ACKPH1_15445, partial [Microcystis panniformis]
SLLCFGNNSFTCRAFASACNWINENVNPRLTNRNSIQAFCYEAANRLTAKQKRFRRGSGG